VYQKKYFNHDFLTRTVCHYGLKKSRVLLLGIQGRYLKATRMALTEVERLEAMDSRGSNEVSEWMEFAKQIAWRSRNRLVQRCCWLEILRSSVRGSIDGSLCAQTRLIDLFGESEILEIDDLLEIFEFAKISTIDAGIIHQQIIDKLEHLDQRSSSIRKEIDQYSEALELIRNDIRSRNRCGTCAILSYSQKCEICLELVYEGKFMVFNTCGHCFHVNCLTDAFAMKLAGRRSDEDVDEIISKSCVLCGEESMLIEDLFTPFVDPGIDADEIDLWKV
jgi:hypothetical protein